MSAIQVSSVLITTLWAILEFVSLFIARRKRIYNRPDISKRLTIVLIVVEASAIGIALLSNGENKYAVVAGALVLIVGWFESHEHFFRHVYHPKRHRTVRAALVWTFRLLGRRPTVRYEPLLGDWIQLLGFGLLWFSPYALMLVLIVFPTSVFVMDRIQAKQLKGADENAVNWWKSRRAIWPRFRFIANIFFIALIPTFLLSVIARDLPIFRGTTQDSVTLMATLAQVEATVGTLFFTLLFLLVQLTTSAYSPRLTRILATRRTFKVALIIAVLSITAKIAFISNVSYSVTLSTTNGENIIIDGVLLFSVLTALAYWVFARDAFEMLSPEAVTREALKGFDTEWMQIIRDEWSSRMGPQSMFIDRDPMFLLERILVSALERGDISSFQTSLILMRDTVQKVRNPHDGAILDRYMSDRFSTVIKTAAEHHIDIALEFFCDIVKDLVTPSSESLQKAEVSSLDIPLGCMLLRDVLDCAIDFGLMLSAERASYAIEQIGIQALKFLPNWSELGLFNWENSKKQLSEQRALWRNDWKLENYVHGYLDYFSKAAQKAIEANMVDVSWTLSSSLNEHIGAIIKQVQEEHYQLYLLRNAFVAIDRIVDAACAKQATRAATQLEPLSFGTLGFSFEAITSKIVALSAAQWLARYTVRLSKALILDYMTVVDIAVATVNLAEHNPEVVLPIIEAFGEAGEALRTFEDFSQREYLMYVHNELVQRIDQIERAGLRIDTEAEVHAAAQKAKSKAQIPQPAIVREDITLQKTNEDQSKSKFSKFTRCIKNLIRPS